MCSLLAVQKCQRSQSANGAPSKDSGEDSDSDSDSVWGSGSGIRNSRSRNSGSGLFIYSFAGVPRRSSFVSVSQLRCVFACHFLYERILHNLTNKRTHTGDAKNRPKSNTARTVLLLIKLTRIHAKLVLLRPLCANK